MQRMTNDALGRMLHNQMYLRLKHFCDTYTPELPSEPVVQSWLSRLYTDDPTLQILLQLDASFAIIAHAVIEIKEAFGHRIVICHQAMNDDGKLDTFLEGAEYIDKLAHAVHATCSLFTVVKHVKAIEKKLGYKVARTVMIKPITDADMEEEDDNG